MVHGVERKLHLGENISAVLPKSGQFQLKAQDRLRLGWSPVKDSDQGFTEEQLIPQNETSLPHRSCSAGYKPEVPPPKDDAAKQESRRKLFSSI